MTMSTYPRRLIQTIGFVVVLAVSTAVLVAQFPTLFEQVVDQD